MQVLSLIQLFPEEVDRLLIQEKLWKGLTVEAEIPHKKVDCHFVNV